MKSHTESSNLANIQPSPQTHIYYEDQHSLRGKPKTDLSIYQEECRQIVQQNIYQISQTNSKAEKKRLQIQNNS